MHHCARTGDVDTQDTRPPLLFPHSCAHGMCPSSNGGVPRLGEEFQMKLEDVGFCRTALHTDTFQVRAKQAGRARGRWNPTASPAWAPGT